MTFILSVAALWLLIYKGDLILASGLDLTDETGRTWPKKESNCCLVHPASGALNFFHATYSGDARPADVEAPPKAVK
jgi:hypothetical protein